MVSPLSLAPWLAVDKAFVRYVRLGAFKHAEA